MDAEDADKKKEEEYLTGPLSVLTQVGCGRWVGHSNSGQ